MSGVLNYRDPGVTSGKPGELLWREYRGHVDARLSSLFASDRSRAFVTLSSRPEPAQRELGLSARASAPEASARG